MLTNLIFLGLLCSGSVFAAAWLKRSSEEFLPITAMTMVLIVFLFGIAGILEAGVVCCVVIAAALWLLCLIRLVQKRAFAQFCKNVITPGFVVFLLVFFGLSVWDVGKLASSWDEFSHWIDIVKVMSLLDDFGTNAASCSHFPAYPPGISIFQYILQKLYQWTRPGQAFNEWRVFFAYQLFCLIPLMPFFRGASFRRPMNVLLRSIAYFATPLLFFSALYRDTYADPVLGLLSGAGLALIILSDKKDWVYSCSICLLCATLVLSKDIGLMFAFFLVAAYGLDMIFNRQPDMIQRPLRKRLTCIAGAAAATLLPKCLWNMEVHHPTTVVPSGNKVDLHILWQVLTGQDDSYRADVWRNYQNALFDHSIPVGYTSITINYVALIVLVFLGSYLLYRLYAAKIPQQQTAIALVMLVAAVQLVAYVFGLSVLYMFSFWDYDAVRLASMNRFLNIVFLSSWMLIIILCIHAVSVWTTDRAQTVCVLSALLVITPMKDILSVVSGVNVRKSVSIRKPYEPLNELIQKYCDGNDRIFFISQDDSGFDYWVTRFNARPNVINSGVWAIGKSDYEGGLYTYDYTPEEWQQILIKDYNYVALYALNDYFYEHYAVLFEDPTQISENALYRIDRKSGLLIRCSDL